MPLPFWLAYSWRKNLFLEGEKAFLSQLRPTLNT
jgi:hypothetical protein